MTTNIAVVDKKKFMGGMILIAVSVFIHASWINAWEDVSLVMIAMLLVFFGWATILDGSTIHPQHRRK